MSKYQITRSWFKSRNKVTFDKYVKPEWKDKDCTYLEIGVFEGASMVWMLENVLIQPNSKAVGIDTWLMTTKLSADVMNTVRQRAEHNAGLFPDKCTLIQGSSVEVLRCMLRRHGYAGIKRNSVDVCLIDGDHNRLGVYDDARIAFQLLKPGGWLMFDDVENIVQKQDHVLEGMKMFLEETEGVELVWKEGYMETYIKL